MNKNLIHVILKDMAKYDQQKRIWLRDKYGSKRTVQYRSHYDELKGASLQRKRIVKILLKAKALTTADDYWNAAIILSMGGSKLDFFMAEYCLSQMARMKNKKRKLFDGYFDKYFITRGWKKSQIKKDYRKWLKNQKIINATKTISRS